MAAKVKPAIRITLEGKNIQIETLVKKRIVQHGFGKFMEKPKAGEISITQKAFDAITRCPYRSGLQGMEIFNNAANCLAWGAPVWNFQVELNDISFHEYSKTHWFNKACKIEK